MSNELILHTFPTGVRDGQGRSLVDTALTNMFEHGDFECGLNVALYLLNHGVDGKRNKANVLCKACFSGNLDVVEELVEQHNVDPTGEYYDCAPPHCTVQGFTYAIHMITCVFCIDYHNSGYLVMAVQLYVQAHLGHCHILTQKEYS